MRPLVLLVALVLALPVLADPFGPPVKVGPESVPHAQVASMPSGPLAVWVDTSGVVKANDRVVTSGAVRPAVASIGDFALVVWTQTNGAVMARRLNADGSPAGIARRIGGSAAGAVAIAAAGDRYLVAWPGTLGAIHAAVVSPLGIVLVPAMPVTTQSSAQITEISAAASADGFAIVWHDIGQLEVYGVTLDANAVPVSMTPFLLSDHGAFPDVASDGNEFFAVWAFGAVEGRTFQVDGGISALRTIDEGHGPRIAWDGFAYAIGYAREVHPRPGFSFHQLAGLRVTRYGTHVERMTPTNTLAPRAFDVDAREGRFDFVFSQEGVIVQSATVREPRVRTRVMRH